MLALAVGLSEAVYQFGPESKAQNFYGIDM